VQTQCLNWRLAGQDFFNALQTISHENNDFGFSVISCVASIWGLGQLKLPTIHPIVPLSRMTSMADHLARYPDSWTQYHVTSWRVFSYYSTRQSRKYTAIYARLNETVCMVISRSSKSQSEYSDFENYFASVNNYHHYSYIGLKSAKRLLRNIHIGIKVS